MKKVIVHKSSVPIYMAAGVWTVYALVFPLYKVGHFAIAAAVALAAYFAGRCLFKDVKEVIEVEPEPERTGNEALDKMIAEGQLALKEMRRLDDAIADEVISGQIRQLEELSGKIFDQVKQKPEKLPQIRKFMDYYLPTTLKLLNAYDRMGAQAFPAAISAAPWSGWRTSWAPSLPPLSDSWTPCSVRKRWISPRTSPFWRT